MATCLPFDAFFTKYRIPFLMGAAALLFAPLEGLAQPSPVVQTFDSQSATPGELSISQRINGSYHNRTGGPFASGTSTGTYGVNKGNNGNGTSATTTLDFVEKTFAMGSGTVTDNTLSFDLANPVGTFEDLSKVEVFLNINGAGFPTTAQLTITGPTTGTGPSYDFSTGSTYQSNYATTAAPVMSASTFYNRVVVVLPSAATSRVSVGVRLRLTSGTKNANTVLIDNVALASGNSSPLPVELTRFDATAKAQGINLAWTTASEKNSARFEVQRSADGEVFETIGTVKAQGNSTRVHEYAFADGKPLAGLSYYRLRQVDTDGAVSFSLIATVQSPPAAETAYPNPSTGIVTLPGTLGTVRYRLYNLLGQTLRSGQAAGNDRLDLTDLPKGPLFLELTGAAGRSTQRLIHE
ncbi:T9SS type A sorting domain-containing protein [Hymenobacter rubidus]|uniref:T9SS type A sorting domain-containing protein n=1 Tax=Hymenobacter rubidus TaxID=1441626 RepID=UPI00191DC37F|nr:T9SS type A sorting domain-containing protein [Hymenobacter rubidus]